MLDVLGGLETQLARSGSELYLVGLPAPARAELVRDGIAERLGDRRVVATIDAALTVSPSRGEPRRGPIGDSVPVE